MKIEINGLRYLSCSIENKSGSASFSITGHSAHIKLPGFMALITWPFPKFLLGRNLENDLNDKKRWDAQLLGRLTDAAAKYFPKRPKQIKDFIREVMVGTTADWLVPEEWKTENSPRLVKVG